MVHKGGWEALRRQGVTALHDALASLVPFLGDRVRALGLHEVNVLDVTCSPGCPRPER